MGSGASMDMSSLPDVAEVRGKLEKLGVSNTSQVVVMYPGIAVTAATRVILLMRYAGIENVALLDGGAGAWKKAGFPVTADVPNPAPGYITGSASTSVGVDAEWVQSHLRSPHIRLIDARDAVYYEGAASPDMGMSAGHIPGAKNVPFSSLFDSASVMLTPAAIEAKFRAAGVQPGDTVIAYCHVGIQATTVVLAARMINQPVRMYIGAFHDWSARKLPTEGGKP